MCKCDAYAVLFFFFFFQAEDGIRDLTVTGVQTCALPISRLAPRERAAVRRLLEQVSTEVTLSRRAETYLRYYTGAFAGVVVVLGAVVVFAGVRLAGHLSRQLSRPIDELVGWTRLIRRRMPLPAGPPTHGAPEFEALRQALRELATALDQARAKELEAER